MLAAVLSVERVSVDSNFFDDLGADSMVMAQFCARVQKAARPAVGVDEGHLPTPHDRAWPGTRGRRACPVEPAALAQAPVEVAETGAEHGSSCSAGRCSS